MSPITRIVALIAAVALAFPAAVAAAPTEQRAYLTVKINGRDQGASLVIFRDDGVLVLASDLKDSNLIIPPGARETVDGQAYLSIRAIDPKATFKLDSDALAVDIRLSTNAFGATLLEAGGTGESIPISRMHGGFVNYALAKRSNEGLTFNGEGVVSVGNGVLRAAFGGGAGSTLAVGQLSWTADKFEKGERTVIGRSQVDVSDFSGSGDVIVLDGLTIVRDHRLNPSLFRNTSSGISGVAESASTVQLYVNGVLVREDQIGAGPFHIANLPLRDGANNATVVIRDAYGRTQSISRPIYLSADLYRRGERDYAVGIGRIVSQGSGAHGMVVAGRFAVGLTDMLTVGTRFEVSPTLWNLGATSGYGTRFGELSAAVSASQGQATASSAETFLNYGNTETSPLSSDSLARLRTGARVGGTAYALAYNVGSTGISAGASIVGQSPFYATSSQPALLDRALMAEHVYLAGGIPRLGSSVHLSWSRAIHRDAPLENERTLALTQRVARGVTATASFSNRTIGAISGPSLGFRIDALLRGRGQVSMSSDTRDGVSSRGVQFEHRPAGLLGTSYAVQVGRDGSETAAEFDVSNSSRLGVLEVHRGLGGAGSSSGISYSGAIAFADGSVFVTRPISQSFAVINVGIPGIATTVNNEPVGTTDRRGRVLASDLFPYQRNDVAIDPNGIPDGSLLENSQKSVAPAYRGGARVTFAIRRVQAYFGRIVFDADPNGSPALGQLTLTVAGSPVISEIGADGTFYFENLAPGRYTGIAQYKAGRCSIQLVAPAPAGTMTDLGIVSCKKESP